MSGTKADLHTNFWIHHSNTLRCVTYRDERTPNDTVPAKVPLYIFRPRGSGVPNIFNFAVFANGQTMPRDRAQFFFFGDYSITGKSAPHGE